MEMDEFLSNLLVWLQVPLIFLGFFLVALYYKLNRKKEEAKVQELKEKLGEESWATPLFNNAGFFVGGPMFLFAVMVTIAAFFADAGIFPLLVGVATAFMGLLLAHGTSFIRTGKQEIVVQPLLWKLLGLAMSQKTIRYDDVLKVKKLRVMGEGNPFIALEIDTKSFGRVKLNTAFYNSEVGNALYELIREKVTK